MKPLNRLTVHILALLSTFAFNPRWVMADSPPNIIFILADDLGYADVGCYGQTQVQTPSIDRLASQGMRFTQAYAGCTTCAPSRCSLMTGMHTGHCTIRGNFGVSGRVPLRDEDVTVAEVLKQAGYATGVIGKWGLGEPDTTGIPNNQGFDYFFGYLNQALAHDYYPDYLWENTTQVWLPGNQNGNENDYSHDLFTTKALDFISTHHTDPFFLYLAYTIPHADIQVPSDVPYSDEPWPQVERDFAAMITRMDTDIGRIMTLLQQLNIDDNTVVFFTSDNGPHAEGGHNSDYFDSNGPLRGIKRDLYEGGIRVPMIVRWPNHVSANTVSHQTWAFWDVLPTLADLAGIAAPSGIDGLSMKNVLFGQPQADHDLFYWESHEGFKQAALMNQWKALRFGLGEPLALYDLATDIGESNDVSGQYPLVTSELREILHTARTESTEWPLAIGCGDGQILNRVKLQNYAGVAPECSALTLAVAGQKAYTDRLYELISVPTAYEGKVLIQHADDDRTYSGNDLLTIALLDDEVFDATVAVAYRTDAIVLPTWLSDWTPTGDSAIVSGFPAGDTGFSFYTKPFREGDVITLGGNSAGGGIADSTYMAFVTTVLYPVILFDPPAIERDVFIGDSLPSDSFTIRNGGDTPLDYTLSEETDWLQVTPTSGSSSGEADPIQIDYTTANLLAGPYQANIVVSSQGAANDGATFVVTVNILTVAPDFDGDGDVDQADFGHLQTCFTHPGIAQNDPVCVDARLDEDDDVDVNDFAVFQACMSGAGVPADRDCDD